ncbi:MAG: PAS domain-containing protein, partial [Xanthomonadales bacterium]|nr:PAS domain-containing protein [Xanthomonadales bacterium]
MNEVRGFSFRSSAILTFRVLFVLVTSEALIQYVLQFLPLPGRWAVVMDPLVLILVGGAILFYLVSPLFGRSFQVWRQDALEVSDVIEEISDSEKRYRELYENSPLGYQSLDADGRFIECNRSLCWMLGYSRDEVIGKWFGDFLTQESRRKFEVNFKNFKKRGVVQAVPFNMVARNGRAVNVEIDGRIGKTEDGDFKQTHCVIHDVTSRRQAQAALQRQYQLNKIITDNAASCLFMTDEAGHTTFMNPAAERITGYTLEEIRERKLHDVIHRKRPDGSEFPHTDCPLIKAQINAIALSDHEDLFVRKNGTMFPVVCHVAPLEQAGAVVGSVLEFRDVTDEKQAEEALLDSRTRYRNLFENMNEGVAVHRLIFDESGTPVDYVLLDVNSAYESILGLSRDEVIGRNASELYASNPPPYLDTYADVAAGGHSTQFETYFQPMRKHFDISVFAPQKNVFATVFTDITAKKRAEDLIRESEEKYRGLVENSLLGVYLSTVEGDVLYVN